MGRLMGSLPTRASQTCDVMTFGQEFRRVLSDGRIVGRAEPFAKVFPSSRAVKKAVGLLAWGVLEDVALDAIIDEHGRLVAETTARRIAANLGLSKTTVHKHLAKLREYGFVLPEELRDDTTGRYEVSCYVIDPTACIERFTATPTGLAEPSTSAANPCHLEVGSSTDEVGSASHSPEASDGEEHTRAPAGSPGPPPSKARSTNEDDQASMPVYQKRTAGVVGFVADDRVAGHPPQCVRDALEAIETHRPANPGGWLVRAIAERWDLASDAATVRTRRAKQDALRHRPPDPTGAMPVRTTSSKPRSLQKPHRHRPRRRRHRPTRLTQLAELEELIEPTIDRIYGRDLR